MLAVRLLFAQALIFSIGAVRLERFGSKERDISLADQLANYINNGLIKQENLESFMNLVPDDMKQQAEVFVPLMGEPATATALVEVFVEEFTEAQQTSISTIITKIENNDPAITEETLGNTLLAEVAQTFSTKAEDPVFVGKIVNVVANSGERQDQAPWRRETQNDHSHQLMS